MSTDIKVNPLPSKTVLSASFHELQNPPDPIPQDDIPAPHEYPYLRLGIMHNHRTLFYPTDVVAGPIEQTISTSPGEAVEVTMELTRRVTVEEENESRGQFTTESVQELSTQDELTDRVSTVLQDTHSTSVSMNVSGTIAIVSGSVGVNDSYTSTQTVSKEQMKRSMKQTTQRVSQQFMKSYVIRSKRVEDVTTRDTFRRLLRNDSDRPMHFGFRKTLQQYLASTQYLGPQLVWHVAVRGPGVTLAGPRIVSTRLLPAAFLQAATRSLVLTDIGGFTRNYDKPSSPVYDWTIWAGTGYFVGARFQNGRDSVTITTETSTYKVVLVCELSVLKLNSNGTVTLRFRPYIVNEKGAVPNSFPISVPTFQLVTVDSDLKIATDNTGKVTIESFLEDYRELLMESASIEARPSGDLRQEEKSILLNQALRRLMLTSYHNNNSEYDDLKRFDEIFETKSAFYQLYPPHYHSPLYERNSLAPEYDAYKGLPPARFGASLGWRIQLDGDARRTEFINSPLARVCIPIARGREVDAIYLLLSRLNYRLAANVTEVLAALSARRILESNLENLGKTEDSLDLKVPSPKVDESAATDENLAAALYPVTEVFAVTEPLTGFVYEPLEL